MSDTNQNQNQDGQKTIVSFIVGLLIGGIVVWMFTGTPAETPTVENENEVEQSEEIADADDATIELSDGTVEVQLEEVGMEIGEGSVSVSNQPASSRVALNEVVFPLSDGWIGVRDYDNGQVGSILGVMRFSESEGLIPEEIVLQRSTSAGNTYAVVFFNPGETNEFNPRHNSQINQVFATFTAE